MGIALVSTGFATWVLSKDVTETSEGSVEIAVVDDKGLKIENLQYSWYDHSVDEYVPLTDSFTFQFEPMYGDDSDTVRWNKTDYEKLEVKITGKINLIDQVNELFVSIEIPESIKALASSETNYIVLPIYTEKQDLMANNVTQSNNVVGKIDKSTGEFEIIVKFEWGTEFAGSNPSEYYDSDKFQLTEDQINNGETVYSVAKTTLQNLRKAAYNCTYVTDTESKIEYEIYNVNGETLYLDHETNTFYECTINNDTANNKVTVTKGDKVTNPSIEFPKFKILIEVTAK